MSVSSGLTNNRGIWTKKYSDGANLYFSTYVEYGSISNGKGLNPSTVKTYLLYKRDRGLVTEWVTAGVLGVDGKFKPLKNSEGFRVEDGKLVGLGSGGLYDYPANDYILGDLARRDLVSDGKDSLRYQTINNSKYLLRIDSGGTPSDVDQAFRISNNITPPGQQPTNSLLGPSLGADQAVPTPSGGQQPPTLTEVTGFEELDITEKTKDYKFAPQSGLRYPNDIEVTQQDRIKIVAKELLPRIPQTEETKFNLKYTFGERITSPTPVDGPVIIAIQAPISDQNSVEWGGDNVNPIDAAVFGLSISLMNSKSFEELGNIIQGLTASLYETFKGTSDRFKTYLAGQAANINNVLARTDNVVLNPNLELLFNGPQLRPFTFTFKMSARTEPEARTIKRIINYFKYHMAARRENNELFLRAPHVFDIQYCYGGESQKHPGINEIKTCALTNFSVDYTPLGSYATYRDGTMTSYTMNMQFQELRPIYDTDYESYKIVDDPKKPVSIGP